MCVHGQNEQLWRKKAVQDIQYKNRTINQAFVLIRAVVVQCMLVASKVSHAEISLPPPGRQQNTPGSELHLSAGVEGVAAGVATARRGGGRECECISRGQPGSRKKLQVTPPLSLHLLPAPQLEEQKMGNIPSEQHELLSSVAANVLSNSANAPAVSVEELITVLQLCWDATDKAFCAKLVHSMPPRMAACIAHAGWMSGY